MKNQTQEVHEHHYLVLITRTFEFRVVILRKHSRILKTIKYLDNRQGPRPGSYSTQLSKLLHILFDNGLFHSTSYFS